MVALKIISLGLLTSVAWMSFLWWVSQKFKNTAMVDLGWGISILIYCLIYFFGTSGLQGKEFLALVSVLMWVARLSYHLYTDRIRDANPVEDRYRKLKEDFKIDDPKKLYLFFQAKGLFNFLLCTPFLLIALSPYKYVSFLALMAFTISYLAIFGEGVADYQLRQFKKNPENQGKVCEVGLWQYSRHPNYFFEFMIWIGFFLLGVSEPYGFLGIVAPLAILFTLLKFTGIPSSEAQAIRASGMLYKSYQERVSSFIPLPPKKF